MLKGAFAVVCLVVLSHCSAQVLENTSILHLRNGAKYIGVVDHRANAIVLDGGVVVKYDPLQIRRLYLPEDVIVYRNGKFHHAKGLYGLFDFGFALDGSLYSKVRFGLGLRLSKELSLGTSVSFNYNEFYTTLPASGQNFSELVVAANTTSITADARYFLNDWKVRSYLYGSLGYGFAVANEWDNLETQSGGLHAEGGVGVQFASRKKTRYFLQVGQYVQKFSGASGMNENPLEPVFDLEIWFKHVGLTAGFTFK